MLFLAQKQNPFDSIGFGTTVEAIFQLESTD